MPILGSKGETIYSGLRVQLVGDAPEHRAAVKNALAAITEPRLEVVESETRLPRPGGETPDVTMVMFNGNEEAAIAYLEAQAAQSPRPAMFALLSGRSPVLMKRLLRAGADELLFLPLDPADTARALLKISEARWRTERREGGVVCSVTSVVGGVGVTGHGEPWAGVPGGARPARCAARSRPPGRRARHLPESGTRDDHPSAEPA